MPLKPNPLKRNPEGGAWNSLENPERKGPFINAYPWTESLEASPLKAPGAESLETKSMEALEITGATPERKGEEEEEWRRKN
eukprot:7275966-Pyramimonas_sp.AAC.1